MSDESRDSGTVGAELAARFLREPAIAEIGNLLLAIVLVVMLAGLVPYQALGAWIAALALATGARTWLRLSAARRVPIPDRVPIPVIISIGAVALCWGLGAWFLLRLNATERELVMIVECGVAAAATASLAASVPAFHVFAAALFTPLIAGLLSAGANRGNATSVGVTIAFWVVMAGLHRRGNHGLIQSVKLTDAVRGSEQRLFKILEAMPVGVLVLDKEVNIYYGNAAVQEIAGPGIQAGDAALALERYPVFMPGTDDEYPRERLPAARALKGESITDQFEVHRPDGPRLIEVHGAPILDQHGSVEYGVAVLSDIGARGGGEQRRATFSAVLRTLNEARSESDLLTGVLATIGLGIHVDVAEIWLVDDRSAVMRRAAAWLKPGDDQLARFDAASTSLEFARGVGLPGRIWRDGSPVWRSREQYEGILVERAGGLVEAGIRTAMGVPIQVGGQIQGALILLTREDREADGALTDTLSAIGAQVGGALERRRADAELRQAQERYRQIVEASSDLVWGVDLGGRWTFVNAACRHIYGMEPEALIGHRLSERSDPDHATSDRDVFIRLSHGETITDYETVHLDVAGNRRPLSTSAAPIRDASGKIVGYHGIARDVRDRAAARDAMREARDAAEQAAAAKSAFLANMSHEIRTPLNGILGMSELLLDGELDVDQRRAVELVALSGRGLLEVINDILDFSKIEAGQMEIEATDFDLHELIDSTVRIVTPAAVGRGVEVITDITEGVPTFVVGDPTRLRQVITNLLGNAVKFTHQGEIVVTVDRPPGADESSLRVTVNDTGIGMDAPTLAAIFEPFRQADSSTTRRYGGTGLGLTISRALVGLMGGTLEVTSEIGRGSRFSFTVPLHASSTSKSVTSEHRASIDGTRVLVVDDNATNQRVICGLLRAAGCVVESASDPQAAFQRLDAAVAAGRPIQLVVSDVQMPGMDGLDFVGRLRADAHTASLPVILASSGSRRGDRVRARTLGVTAYLMKPISRRELLDAAAAAVAEPRRPLRRESTAGTIVQVRDALRILLAEDNAINQQVAAAMLRRRGHLVTIVDDGRSAVREATAATYDVILMDIQMPGMDGIEATAEIRRVLGDKPVAIVALTANAMSGERERCLAAGMDGYLSKPFTARDLFAAVEGDEGDYRFGLSGETDSPADALPVDLDALRAELRDADVEDSMPAIIALFLDDSPKRIAAIETAAAARDAHGLSSGAHALKSAAGTLRCGPLVALLSSIEADGRAGRAESAIASVPALVAEYERVRQFLQRTALQPAAR